MTLKRVGCNVTLHCSSTSLGPLLCCMYKRLHSVYNELRNFLVRNGPTPKFTLTFSCLGFISVAAMTARRQLSNVISVFSVSLK